MSADLTAAAVVDGADRLLELRARGGVFVALLICGGLARARATAGAAAAARRLCADRLLGVARRRSLPASRWLGFAETRAQPGLGRPALQPVGGDEDDARSMALRLVYGAVAAVLGLQLVGRCAVRWSAPSGADRSRPAVVLRITDARRARWSWSTISMARPRRPAGRTSAWRCSASR